jgi:HAD superfamily hydrolase (TIGR01549 family)
MIRKLKYPWVNYIWDLGGTLMDNYKVSATAFTKALDDCGIRVDFDEVYRALRVSTDYAVHRFAPNTPGFVQHYRELEAPHLEDPVLFEGAIDVLESIVSAGGANFLVSHRDNQVFDILKVAGIEDYFTEVVTKDSGLARKPEPESFNYLLQKYQLDPHSTATVGDRPIDVEAGIAAGIASVYFDPPRAMASASVSISALTDLLV